MEVKVLNECGYDEALLGISLSYNQPVEKMERVAEKLAPKDGGENKFLESIYIWIDVTAPRFFWAEADTYRLSTKQSESTMHTIMRGRLTQEHFEYPIYEELLRELNNNIDYHNAVGDVERSSKIEKDFYFMRIKNLLPEGFLQRRIWVMNYKCFRNIYKQRINHRLPQWQTFCNEIMGQIEHPELIVQE